MCFRITLELSLEASLTRIISNEHFGKFEAIDFKQCRVKII